jgi:hypothetical protein
VPLSEASAAAISRLAAGAFDYFVGAREQRGGNGEAKSLGCFEIDH